MSNVLIYFSTFEFYFFVLFLIIIGSITQSAIGIGFGIPACFLVLLEPSMVPSCIVLMGSFLAFSNAMLSFKDIIKVDLIYAYIGRIIGSLLAKGRGSLTDCTALGALWHGRAAETLARQHGQEAVTTSQVLDYLSFALRNDF